MIKSLLRFGSFSAGIFFTILLLSGCVEEVGSISPDSAKTVTVTNAERNAKYESIRREVMADEHPAPSVSSEKRKFNKKVKRLLKPKKKYKKKRKIRRRTKKITKKKHEPTRAVVPKEEERKEPSTPKRKLPSIVKYY